MKIDASLLQEMKNLIPEKVNTFKGSQYPLPVKTAILGKKEIDLEDLCKSLEEKLGGDVKNVLETLLVAAELHEAAKKDKHDYFIKDSDLRSFVFTGSKWKAGWVLILGDKHHKLAEEFKQKDFMVFTDTPKIKDSYYIGSRDTSPIYFLQMMVRYGFIWGRIAPGDSHRLSHYLEEDMPGLIVIYNDLDPLKYLITLGLMKMGAPAVVPSTFPYPYGNRIVADTVDEIIEKGTRFPNLRVQYYQEEVIDLPDYCNIAYKNENIKNAKLWGGSRSSFFLLKSSRGIKKSIEVTGDPVGEIGIIVEIEDKNLSYDMEDIIEKQALRSISYISGYRASQDDGVFTIKTKPGTGLNPDQIGEAIYWGIRLEYPRIKKIKVNIFLGRDFLKKESKKAREYKKIRKQYIARMSEENTDKFCACIECRPFSLEHTCILTPDRIPMCASRTYFSVKAGALFGNTITPYQRKTEKILPLKNVFSRGKILNKDLGEYQGTNKIYRELTRKKLSRVFLHSLRGYPQTSCGCFQNLAFWIKDVEGIGIMSRDSEAKAPNGMDWDKLANLAGGKQTDGIMGVSTNYIKSRNFLKGDGGIGNIAWVDSDIYKKISGKLMPGQKIATEKDVDTIEELKSFIGSKTIRSHEPLDSKNDE